MKTKRFTKRMITVLLMVLISVMMVFPANAATKEKLNYSQKTITVGQTFNLKVNGTSSNVKWSSSNKSVASVSSKGVVTARRAGTAKIIATVKSKTFTCKVTVMNNIFQSSAKPGKVAVKGNGVNLFVTKMQYSGNKLVVNGFFTNGSKKRVLGLKNYKIRIYVTLSNGKVVQLTNGMFNMNVNIPAGGYQNTTLTFSGNSLNPTVYDLRTAKSSDVMESGTLLSY